MIDPHWSLVDLDPRTWRAIGRFFDPGNYIRAAQPDEHGLFVLHNGERVLRVVDTQSGVRRDLALDGVGDPHALADRLHAHGEWQRVHVIDQRHLADVARQAQAAPRRDLTLDQYYHLVYRLLWAEDGGYVCVPARPASWNGWTYTGIQAFVAGLPDAATLALGVLEGAELAIGLILELRGGLIRTVTTFEALDNPAPGEVSIESLDQLWALLERRSATAGAPPPAGVLLCTQAAFDAWLAADDKRAALERASAGGAAYWRLLLREPI
jgi:hypothetical protein